MYIKGWKNSFIDAQDKRCISAMLRFNKGMDWLKLNHYRTWHKYSKLLKIREKDLTKKRK